MVFIVTMPPGGKPQAHWKAWRPTGAGWTCFLRKIKANRGTLKFFRKQGSRGGHDVTRNHDVLGSTLRLGPSRSIGGNPKRDSEQKW